MQIDALLQYGVQRHRILTDQASGKSIAGRVGFKNAMKAMRPGAGLVIWKLDRLGRNVSELIMTADLIRSRDAQLISLTENFDTGTPSGTLMFNLIGMFAQYERDMISERTKSGLAARKARGAKVGRKKILDDPEIRSQVVELMREGKTFPQIAALVEGVKQSTLYNHQADLHAEVVAEDIKIIAEELISKKGAKS